MTAHDDVIKWKHLPRYWPFVRDNHRSPMDSPHKGQWCGALMFSLIYALTNGWVNSHDTGDLRRHRARYDVIVMWRDFAPYFMGWIQFTLFWFEVLVSNIRWTGLLRASLRVHVPKWHQFNMIIVYGIMKWVMMLSRDARVTQAALMGNILKL